MKHGVQIVKERQGKWGVTFLLQRTNRGAYTVKRRANGKAMVKFIDHSKPDALLELLRTVSRALEGQDP